MRTSWLGWFAVAVLLGLAVYAFYPASQPVFQGIANGEPVKSGRTPSYWLEVLNQPVGDDTTKSKVEAAKALGEMGPAIVPQMLTALRDRKRVGSWPYIQDAIAVVGKPAVEPLIEAAHRDPLLMGAAESTLIKIGRPAVPSLAAVLKEPDDEYRVWAANILSNIGPDADEAVDALIAAFKDPRDSMRRGRGAGSSKAQSGDQSVRVRTARGMFILALGRIGPGAKSAVPVIMEALKEDHVRIHLMAITALGNIGPGAGEAIPALIKELKHNGYVERRDAATAIAKIGNPAAMAAVPGLVELARDPDPQVADAAKDALAKIDPVEAAKLGVK